MKELSKLNQRTIHHIFVQKHKRLIRLLDCMFILSILFNFGALSITNALVIKELPKDKYVLVESNPKICDVGGIPCHSEGKQIMNMMVYTSMIWAFIILGYMWLRNKLKDMRGLWTLVLIIAFGFILTGNDFFSDFGIWIGQRVFGG